MKLVLGIDPGATGAIVCINEYRTMVMRRFINHDYPTIAQAVQDWSINSVAYIEKVGAMQRDSNHNAFAFGKGTGILHGMLIANRIPIKEVAPQVWQRHFKLGAAYPSKKERKHAHLAKAKELFPEVKKMTLDMCDAILIAQYAWDMEFGV